MNGVAGATPSTTGDQWPVTSPGGAGDRAGRGPAAALEGAQGQAQLLPAARAQLPDDVVELEGVRDAVVVLLASLGVLDIGIGGGPDRLVGRRVATAVRLVV